MNGIELLDKKIEYYDDNFVHLHLHTEYSLLDGYARIGKVLDKAVSLGMKAVAITDHGVMYGCVNFYKACKKRGLKPIIGCEVYVSKGDYRDKSLENRAYNHLILLVKDQEGYKNLIKLVSESFVNGFYYKPRIDKNLLKKHSKGLICLSACLNGEIQEEILKGNIEGAKKLALDFEDIFGEGNFYLELQDHGLREQKTVNRYLNQLHRETGIGLVCTNDVHYVDEKDHDAHEILLCIQTGKTLDDEGRMSFPSREFYFKSYEEMKELFSTYEEAIENTSKIAEMCNFDYDFSKSHLPHFEVPSQYSNIEYLNKLVYEGIEKKYELVSNEVKKRVDKELSTIENMGFVDYFLIVWDFIAFAKKKKIAVGPGRGSAAGSIVAYALGITEIDPIKYDLLFERFLNPERVSMPDIDIDFCYERRDEVIDYVNEKYGPDHVAQIVTFGTMKAKNAIRDVGRALNVSLSRVDYLAKLIPFALKMTIDLAMELNPELKSIYEESEEDRRLIDYARALEDMPRHTSTHAAGVVIASKPIDQLVPLSKSKDQVNTQYTMTELEELGLLKMDFLGLRTLTVIQDAVKLVKINHNIDLDMLNIDLQDKKVLDLFQRADTIGIFQFESSGMRNFLKELKASRFDDLIAANALFRPGPMDQIPKFIEYRHNPDKVKYLHPSLEKILVKTYGTIVYQEQVMQIARELAGYSMGDADNLRRAMSKKKQDVILENREYFIGGLKKDGKVLIKGCVNNNISEETANAIYDLMVDFAKYAFNKSHSAAYAFVAMQTAFLKVYYPREFFAALLSSVMNETDKVSLYIQEAKNMGIEILPPNINKSFKKFSVENDKIRFGMLAIKNVGASIIDISVRERKENGPYLDLNDYVERLSQVENSNLNKKAVESLIKSGAFSDFKANKAQLMASFEGVIEAQNNENKRNIRGQRSIFDMVAEEKVQDNLPNLAEYSNKELLEHEKEVLGIYVSGHHFSPYQKKANALINARTIDFSSDNIANQVIDEHKIYVLAGIISKYEIKFTKSNAQMCFIELEDIYGVIEIVVFARSFEKYKWLIKEDKAVLIKGRIDISDEENPKILLSSMEDLDKIELGEKDDRRLYLRMKSSQKGLFDASVDLLRKSQGKNRVIIYYSDTRKKLSSDSLTVNLTNELKYKLEDLLGKENVIVK